MICFKRDKAEVIARHRKPGYLEWVVANSEQNGDYLCMQNDAFSEARRLFSLPDRTGLGDLVAMIAEPIARASDRILGTKIVGCGGCAKRRETLNRFMPDIS